MKKIKMRIIYTILALILVLNFTVSAVEAAKVNKLDEVINDTAKYMYENVEEPIVGSIGGEWAIIGLARSGYNIPEEYYQDYYETVEEYVRKHKGELHDVKYTEYSRVIVALSSIGKDARNVAGYDLTIPLGDYDKTIYQGLNGPIWALLALDSRDYDMPVNPNAKTQATREMYIDRILDVQLSDGGWSLFGGTSTAKSKNAESDPDITGMAIQALAKYQDNPKVKKATEEALECMSKQQNSKGGFSSWGSENSESCVQIITALGELGIPLDDPRFVKNGNTTLDNLMTFYRPSKGFLHTQSGSGENQMASEQGFYGVIAAQRLRDNKNSLYRMSDAIEIKDRENLEVVGLENKHKDVKKRIVIVEDITFNDIKSHKNKKAIDELAKRKIIDGRSEGVFDPNTKMTRAEFATIVVRALGLEENANNKFKDVKSNTWYASYIGTANDYGIVKGISDTKFNPEGTITKEEAATMVARAGKLCGIETELDTVSIRDILAQFPDYINTEDWSRESLAYCYYNNILNDKDININPKEKIVRSDIAQMIYNMLEKGELL